MTLPERLFTATEYLAIERAAPYKSEFINGRIYAMSGASANHNRITVNIGGLLHSQLRGRPCEAFASEMRVKVSPTGAYFYPDLTALCGKPEFDADAELDTLVNPTVVVEVLSDSTEAFNRGDKFAHYRRVPSLQEYVLVAQDRPFVERHVRTGDTWTLIECPDPDDTVEFASIGCALRLREIYERVEFARDAARTAPRLVREPDPPPFMLPAWQVALPSR